MRSVLLLGAGKIGRMASWLLSRSGDYDVLVADADREALARIADQQGVATKFVDATDARELQATMRGRNCVVSALSYQFNPQVAQAALESGISYFDLTEDIETTRAVRAIAAQSDAGQIFMPQCGLAPGFISIVAQHLTRSFETLDSVHMRVGALPQFPTNHLKYNLTWSTDGLINEYCNPCDAIHDGRRSVALPFEGLENFSLDGIHYEAFNTSGGIGTLCETLEGRVRELNYKTVRYVGHRDLMQFLVQELQLGRKRAMLKAILEDAIPITFQDVVIVFCTVTGRRRGQLVQVSDARKVYRQSIDGEFWSAIQITTAAGVCAALDLHFEGKLPASGFVRQEDVDFPSFIENRFGRFYQTHSTPRFTADSNSQTRVVHADGSLN